MQRYDVVIIGSGLGGATTALVAARAGLKVAVLEKGDWAKRDETDWNPRKILIEQRYKSESATGVRQYGDSRYQEKYLNEVVGGQSVFYGGAAFRFRENDFAHWPISYQDLEPFYCEAEELLGVVGAEDKHLACEPFRSKPFPFSPIQWALPAIRIREAARKLNYQASAIPLAIQFDPNGSAAKCALCNTCDGFPCKVGAKNEGSTILQKAMKLGVQVFANQAVDQLIVKDGKIESLKAFDKVRLEWKHWHASVFVLSAGALASPAIALRSKLDRGSAEKWIGKNLMRHCNAIVGAVFPFRTNPENAFHKQVCLLGFYEDMRQNLGTSTGVIQDIYMPAKEVVRHFTPVGLKSIAAGLSNYIQNLLCVAEDDPQERNRVRLSERSDAFGIREFKIDHHYTDSDYLRRNYLIKKAKDVLGAAGGGLFKTYKIDTFSHAVGTLRFSERPENGVLNADCRFHDLPNLYAIDGSFFPTSGGVNPSLTIVANALRAARSLVANLSFGG